MNVVLIATQTTSNNDVVLHINGAARLASGSVWSAALPESHCSNPQPDTMRRWGANLLLLKEMQKCLSTAVKQIRS